MTELANIGLNKDEAKVYLALLGLGQATIAEITRASQQPRSNCYLFINRLIEKGLASETKFGRHILYSAASPERLKALAIEKEQDARIQKEKIESFLPELLNLAKENRQAAKIQYFTGKSGVRAIFEDLLTSDEIRDYYIGSLEKVEQVVGENFLKNWMHRRVQAGIFSYGVRIKSEELPARTYRSSRKMMREIRYAPKGFSCPQYIVIYGHKVAMVSSQKEGFGLIVDSLDLAETQKSLFDILWKASKKFHS